MSRGVVLRDVKPEDLESFFQHQSDPESNWMASFPARDRRAFAVHWARIMADESVIKRTIVWDGQIAGNIVSWEQDGERLVGYWIGRGYWGRGIATLALRSFIDEVPERPLHAHVAKNNPASIRVLEKCGFIVANASLETAGKDDDGVEEMLFSLDL